MIAIALRQPEPNDYSAMQAAIDTGEVWSSPWVGDALALIEAGLCQPNPDTWRAQQNAMFDQHVMRQDREDNAQEAYLLRRSGRR